MLVLLSALASAVCGDGVLDVGEACDDHNTVANDGCDALCEVEYYWECAQPPEPFVQTVRWDGQRNCSIRADRDLSFQGARVALPEWRAFSMTPTGASCMSYWSSGDRYSYRTEWQAGPRGAAVGGQLPGGVLSLAQCRSTGPSATVSFDPQGQTTLYLGLRDNPCLDNRGNVELTVRAVSECEFKGDLDGDGVLNDDDVCPTVYKHLPGPYEANLACVSELATWDDAIVGTRALVHRDAVVSGTVIGPKAEIGRDAQVGPGSVVMRAAWVGPRAQVGAEAVLATRSVVGEDAAVGARTAVGHGVGIGARAVVADDVTVWPFSDIGADAVVGGRTAIARMCTLEASAQLAEDSVLGPDVAIGQRAVVGASARVRRGAQVGADCVVGNRVRLGRSASLGDRAVIGDDATVRGAVPADGVIPSGGTVPR